MRTLTISRTKTSVNCFYKLRVCVEDPTGDIAVNGKFYRFIGDIKNGESRIFQIDEEARELFVYFTNNTRHYCNDTYQLPAGSEDVVLSGKPVYNPANANAFRFDGEATAEVIQNRKRANKAGIVVAIIAVLVGILIGVMRGLASRPKPETFTAGNLSITLTDHFEASDDILEYTAYYESADVLVILLEEKKSTLGAFSDCSLDEYARLVMAATELPSDTEIHHDNGLTWLEYNDDSSGKEYNYFTVFYQTSDAFWSVQFVSVAKHADSHRAEIIEYAQSVKFN